MAFRWITLASLSAGMLTLMPAPAVSQDRPASPPLYSLQRTDGTRALGRMQQLTADRLTFMPGDSSPGARDEWSLQLHDVIALDRVIARAEFPDRERVATATMKVDSIAPVKRVAPRLWLANGDRIAVELIELDDAQLTARVLSISTQPTWKIPLELVRGYAEAERSVHAADFAGQPTAGAGPNADLLSLKNGDRIAGELQGFSGGEFTFETNVGVIKIPLDGIEAFAMNPELMEIPKIEGHRALTVLTDGSYLTLTDLQSENSARGDAAGTDATNLRLSARTSYGQAVTIPISDLKNLMFLGRYAVMLSDREAAGYEFTPFFSRTWDYQIDRNATSGPLIVAGREYIKGVGLHSQCRLTYELDDQFTRFQAEAGIDDAVGEKGQAWLSILVDGEPRVERVLLQGSAGVKEIGVDRLERARQLTIVVEFGPFGDVGDHVDLVNPMLIRQSTVRR
ncbi:MAG: NPCBM/NEW2 domain-containing protein [Planctomycetaceae bacterium]